MKNSFFLQISKESLSTLNQVAIFLSSSFIVSKRFSILGWEVNKFVSSANIIGVSLLELLKRSFIYIYIYEKQKWSKNGALWYTASNFTAYTIFVFTE